jgi:hypothetical protein
MTLSDKQRLDRIEARQDRLERATAENTVWVKGNWFSSRGAAGQILAERRDAERDAAEREARVRDEVTAGIDAEVAARLADGGVR